MYVNWASIKNYTNKVNLLKYRTCCTKTFTNALGVLTIIIYFLQKISAVIEFT